MKRVVLVPGAMAQSDLGFKSIGFAVGVVDPQDLDGTMTVGVVAGHGTLAPRIGLESHMEYWRQSESLFGTEASVRDIAIGARAKYLFQVAHPKLQPFAGVGLGLHFVHAEVVFPPVGGFPAMIVEDSSTKLGLDLGTGLATSVAPRTDLLAEAWMGIVSDVNQVSLRVGLSHKLVR